MRVFNLEIHIPGGNSGGTPIIRNGKVVGYAVQVDANAQKLPMTMAPIGNMPTDNNFPELKAGTHTFHYSGTFAHCLLMSNCMRPEKQNLR